LSLSTDGATVALVGRLLPRAEDAGAGASSDAWVADMRPGIGTKAGLRRLTRATGLNESTVSTIRSVGISGDAKLVVFDTNRTDFSALTDPSPVGSFPSLSAPNLYVVDRTASKLERATRAFDGSDLIQATAGSGGPFVSKDGKSIVWTSEQTNIVA